jgi:type IV pilus assembly protein PilW
MTRTAAPFVFRIVAASSRARGVTLIELMVGLAIGLLATLVIAQVLTISEGRRRTKVTGSEAQVSGSLALYSVRREIEMAGYGLTASTSGLGCPIRAQRAGTNYATTLAPLLITQGAADAPDTIQIISSAKLSYAVPARVVTNHPSAGSAFFVNTSLGAQVGDLMVAVPPTIDVNNWCSVFNITSLTGSTQINHVTGVGGEWNQAGGSTIFPAAGYVAGSYLVNLGQFVTRTMTVSGTSTLQATTFSTASATTTTEDLFPDVVQLKAMYAKDTDADGLADTYDYTTPTTSAGWQQVKGIRLAIVSRSAQMEKENVTFANPLWDVGSTGAVAGSAACGASNCVSIKVDNLADWQRYRYKVYDTIVPLRNLLWRT